MRILSQIYISDSGGLCESGLHRLINRVLVGRCFAMLLSAGWVHYGTRSCCMVFGLDRTGAYGIVRVAKSFHKVSQGGKERTSSGTSICEDGKYG